MITLTAEQQAAVDMVAAIVPPRVVCLSGMPGAGKTVVVRFVVDALQALGRSVVLCAPSGKAAKRLAESSGREARTIHRLLGLRHDVSEPQPIAADVVICDESSMVSIDLLELLVVAAFSAGGRAMTILLVGDPEQLPPVGAGSPFLDMLAAEACPTVRLTKPQRQALDSGIVAAAYAIHEGRLPEWREDFQFVSVPEAEDLAGAAWDLVREHGAQVLSPQRTRSGGTEELNAFIDRADWVASVQVNADRPYVEDYETELVRGFRVGSRVLHTKNNYQLGETGVFNGEGGVVTRTELGTRKDGKPSPRGDELDVLLDDGREVTYRGAVIRQLLPGWALTIHKSQGSEWANVVVICHPGHSFMLTRALLYVAATRARKCVWVVGTEEAVAKALGNTKDVSRKTNLAHMLAGGVA